MLRDQRDELRVRLRELLEQRREHLRVLAHLADELHELGVARELRRSGPKLAGAGAVSAQPPAAPAIMSAVKAKPPPAGAGAGAARRCAGGAAAGGGAASSSPPPAARR